jgi:hypothetical protein
MHRKWLHGTTDGRTGKLNIEQALKAEQAVSMTEQAVSKTEQAN